MAKRPEPIAAHPEPLGNLVARVARGDETALSALYDATSSRVFGLALGILRDRGLAEEAALDVYTQVWRQSGRYDENKGSVLAWLLIMTRTRALDLLRASGRRREEPLDLALKLTDASPGPEAEALGSARARQVRAAMDRLPKEQRSALEAVYFGGLSHSEVAGALGQPLGTVKTRIRDGLAALRLAMASQQEGSR